MSTSTAGPAAGRAARAPRTAVVLAGGAALGAMQAGMVHALYERGIAPDLLIGTSAGALNAAFLASRPATVATAQELAATLRWPIPHHRTPAATNRLTQDPVPILFTGRQAPIRSEDRHGERAPLKTQPGPRYG